MVDNNEPPNGGEPVLDLNSVIPRSEVSLTPQEHPDLRKERVFRERNSAKREHFQQLTIFVIVVIGVVLLVLICLYIILIDKTADPDTKQWSKTIFSSVVTGSLGFLFGKAVGSK